MRRDVLPGTGSLFARHLCARAGAYFPEYGERSVRVRLAGRRSRPFSTLHLYEIKIGGETRNVLLKELPSPGRSERFRDGGSDRPRLGSPLEPERRCEMEYQMLAAVHRHLGRLGDPRFGAVRVLDVLPDRRALVMELVPYPSLRDLLRGRARLWGSARTGADLEGVFRNAGAWLRTYQELPPPSAVEPRHTCRDAFLGYVDRVTEFLSRASGDRPFFGRVARAVATAGEVLLPEALPLGLNHADYAMRNVLVGPASRVTVIDTTGRWRTSIYEDVGYFLTDLECSGIQVLSQGRALGERASRYAEVFLEGYFGRRDIPRAIVGLYEIQAMLDRWASSAARRAGAGGARSRAVASLRLGAVSRYLRRRIETRMAAWEA